MWTSSSIPIENYNLTRKKAYLAVTAKIGAVSSTTSDPVHENQTQKSIKDLLYNGTGYYIEDEGESGLSDIQTVFLACIATLIPLTAILMTAFGIRLLWRRYKKHNESQQYDGIIHGEETSESVTRPLHSHLLTDKTTRDAHLNINTEVVEVCDTTEINNQIRGNNHSNTNGSIITMTLKNNHLIVETEERNDIVEDSRETTMKYSPGARDGVFVVEVQQGVRRSPGSGGPNSGAEPDVSGSVSDQCALVHNPPDRYSDEETLEECDDSEYYIETASPNTETPDSLATQIRTGLAQSNTSLTQPSYCYTSQQCYDSGGYGYTVYAGYVNDEPSRRLPDHTRPRIMAAVYKTTVAEGTQSPVNAGRSDDEAEQERNVGSPKVERSHGDLSPSGEETEAGSVEPEDEGLDHYLAES